MAPFMPFSLMLTLLFPIFIISSSSIAATSTNQDLLVAIQEMQRATYFTYVVLINMAPENSIQGNITFLMPHDRILANTSFPQNDVADFLLRHSIPTPLLFDHLQHFPTGSMLPTSKPDFMLRVGNYGRRQFFLNHVRIISPNICTAGSSIRCHGIDGVIVESQGYNTPPTPSPACSVNSTISPPVIPPPPPAEAALPAPALLPVVPPDGSLNLTPAVAPATSPKKSGSSGQFSGGGLVQLVMICGLVVTMLLL